jgi:hypothetical protein
MEYNSESNSMQGKPKGKNFYMGGKETFKSKPGEAKIILDNAINKDLGNDLLIQREKREIKEYNEALITNASTTDANGYVYLGNAVVIRLFKHDPHVESAFIKERRPITVRVQDSQSGKVKTEEAFLQYINRGVIVNKSGKYSDFFNENFGIGDVVDLKFGISIEQQMTFLDSQKFYLDGIACFDNYFLINENMIEKKVLNYGK